MNFHDVANIFPLMSGNEYEELKADIASHGQREPIWLHNGLIIDGRNRYKACVELGVEPIVQAWDGEGSLVAFVLSLNLHRRHLTTSQRAVVALEVLPMLEVEAKGRQVLNALNNQPQNSQKIDYSERASEGKSASQAATLTGTNRQYVSDVKRIAQDAPELIEPIRDGRINIPMAKLLAEAEPEQRADIAVMGRDEIKGVVEEIKKAHVAHNSGNNEWYTPNDYITMARRVLGEIDLDPASSAIANERVGARVFFTKEDDGLSRDWFGNVWMNPPYESGLIGKFSEKMVSEYLAGNVTSAIVLVNNATETAWFKMMIKEATAVCFPYGRVRFLDPDGNLGAPLQGQAVIYLGNDRGRFVDCFSGLGWCAYVC